MLILTLLALSLWALYLHFSVLRTSLVRRETRGLLTYEVRRRVYMEVLPPDLGRYPEPREVRSRVLLFAGIALWHEDMSIALPLEACEHLEDVRAQDFDRGFPERLRMGAS